MRKEANKVVAIILIATLFIPTTIANASSSNEKRETAKKEYLVLTKTKKTNDKISKNYMSVSGEYTENIKEENISLQEMTPEQVEKLEENKDVLCVEENISFTASSKYINPKDVDSDWNLDMIHAAADSVGERAEKIKAAIIDSGVDDCDGIKIKERINLVPMEEEIQPCFDDGTGHGTAVASIIAAEKTDERESYGINSNVELYSIKVMDGDNTAPLNRVVEGIYTAIDKKVNIINMSFGTTTDSEILHKAIQDAYDAGILMIAAAGNRGNEDGMVEYPAAYEEVMAVGSLEANGDVAESSSRGNQVDVMAPGEYVKTATNFGFETVSSGTSMATPHVVGIASLLWQKDKTKSANFIRELIKESAKGSGKSGEKYSIIDFKYALKKYDEFELNYKNKSYNMKENNSILQIDENMAKVTAHWSKNKHEALVTTNKNQNLTTKELKWIRAGIRYNDVELYYDSESRTGYAIWHSLTKSTNYMSAIYLVGKIIQKKDCSTDDYTIPSNANDFQVMQLLIPGLSAPQQSRIVKDINAISIKKLDGIAGIDKNSDKLTDKTKRLVLFGMELHIITDAFAHRAYERKKYHDGRYMSDWTHIVNVKDKNGKVIEKRTDNIDYVPSRYKAAGKVVKNAMDNCLVFSNGSLSMSKTKLILSKQIVLNNTYFDGSFLLWNLGNYANMNAINDATFFETDVYQKLFANTYSEEDL